MYSPFPRSWIVMASATLLVSQHSLHYMFTRCSGVVEVFACESSASPTSTALYGRLGMRVIQFFFLHPTQVPTELGRNPF